MPGASKAVLITGCSTGIGRASALRLAHSGWSVYATARRLESIADLANAGCHTLALDVTDEQSMQTAVQAVEAAEGNLGSMGGRLSFPGGGHYHATKYALEAISDALRFELRGFGIDVILLEPGLITTEFGDAATASMTTVESSPEDPYAHFNATVGAVTKGAYEGPMRMLGAGPERVAKVIERAITRSHPRARITITPSAKLSILSRSLMSDRAWDAAMRRQFPSPGAQDG